MPKKKKNRKNYTDINARKNDGGIYVIFYNLYLVTHALTRTRKRYRSSSWTTETETTVVAGLDVLACGDRPFEYGTSRIDAYIYRSRRPSENSGPWGRTAPQPPPQWGYALLPLPLPPRPSRGRGALSRGPKTPSRHEVAFPPPPHPVRTVVAQSHSFHRSVESSSTRLLSSHWDCDG